jgi:mannosyl-oligosaccharide alpha-1,2-mannosidase
MVSYLSTILAPLALQATVVAGLTPTGNGPASGPTQLAAPLRSGSYKTVASGPHPSYTWPPTEATVTPTCKAVQYQFPSGTNSDPTRANAVKDLYRRSWDQYAKYCFGHDQILTLNNTCADDIFGWGATIVDGIDTAIVMNLTDIVTRQLAFIADVDFTYDN